MGPLDLMQNFGPINVKLTEMCVEILVPVLSDDDLETPIFLKSAEFLWL